MAKNIAVFCLWTEILSEAEFTSNRLNCLAEEISSQCSTQAPGRLLFTAVKQTYSEREEKAEFRLVGLKVDTQMTDAKVS